MFEEASLVPLDEQLHPLASTNFKSSIHLPSSNNSCIINFNVETLIPLTSIYINWSLYTGIELGNQILYHCSTQLQPGSMHSAPADVGDE